MFPKIYYLAEPMTQPVRCFDSLILLLSLDDDITIVKDGQQFEHGTVHLINESELYEIKSKNVLIFYLPNDLFKARNIDIFNQYFSINQPDDLKVNLKSLFKYYQFEETSTEPAKQLLTQILYDITRVTAPFKQTSTDVLGGIIDYIHQNIHQHTTLEMLSKQFYISTSHLSLLFKKQMNMTFHEYTASLRIAKSMKDLSHDNKKIKVTADIWNYPSSTNYIIHFKKYLGVTPKKYKSLSAQAKGIPLNTLISDDDVLKQLKFEVEEQKEDILVQIDDTTITEHPFSYFNLIDIGPFENIDLIMNEPVFSYKNISNYRLKSYVYVNEPMETIIENHQDESMIKFKKLLNLQVPIALKLSEIESYQFISNIIKDLYFFKNEHPLTMHHDNHILLLLDLNTIPLSAIKQIQHNIYDTQISIAVDITDYFIFDQPLDESISELQTDFYAIDFKKIKDFHQRTQQEVTFKTMQSTLYAFMIQNNIRHKAIFLNYYEFYAPNLLNNKALFLEESLKGREFLAGATINFTQSTNKKPSVAIFDNIENKRPFFFLGYMLLNFSKYPCYYGHRHIITQTVHGYNVLTFNIEDCPQNFKISIPESSKHKNILISTEVLNNEYGGVDRMIDQTVTDKSYFPYALKFKLSQYNSPYINVQQHDFNQAPYQVCVPPKSITLVTLYT
ncbi:helix-turn-helix transcriptional regulator [Staphylococcus sp. IVB6238]|uniref:helix-turn-helix transcriptional regulator n=1 Tax=unclassified Staphylococcus TaxID=91994 RepID=UPI0021D267F7|nr:MULTISPECIES: helix-turn-helix transcriptional regulator [unclassified Staphylococcus]UXR72178.1 helix-turn-helix transcriptional regulator [Staphylococcus sp. IVB6240]UXR74486.1 helix-turn-helix transcriptional regulator [Staphylococcus sp. IVB6238]